MASLFLKRAFRHLSSGNSKLALRRPMFQFSRQRRWRPLAGAAASASLAATLFAVSPPRARADDDTPFHLGSALSDIRQKVAPHGMLDLFQMMIAERGGESLDLEFLEKFFREAGVEDNDVAYHVFKVMDFDGSGLLECHEVAAVMTLFQRGGDIDRFKFLFKCLDLDGNGVVDKTEFRQLLTALLNAKYHLSGLHDPVEPDEIFVDIEQSEYNTVAKWRANRMTREIFIFADQNRDGELSLKEFLHWCRRGGKDVDVLRNVLRDTLF